ncbi:hypothetical protein KAJ27_10830, partial [bacterium]|nr:hypothetical protein [bacterium]
AYLTLPEDGDWSNEIDTMLHIQKVLNGNIQFNLESVDEATKWLEKSAASGNEEAKEWLEWISDIEPTEETELEDETDLNGKIELDGKSERVEEIVQDDCCVKKVVKNPTNDAELQELKQRLRKSSN